VTEPGRTRAIVRRLTPRSRRARLARRIGQASAGVAAPLVRRGALTHHFVREHCTGRGVEVGPGTSPYCNDATLIDRTASFLGDRVMTSAIGDACALPIASASQDYLLSAHCLEHQHDVLAALQEWVRVLRPGGALVLILPHVDRTFDRGRPVSDLAHHLAETGAILDPDDPLHWDDFETHSLAVPHEWMSEPDARLPDGGWNRRWIVERGLIHYHAWTQAEMAAIVGHLCQLVAIVDVLPERPDSFLIVGRVRPA
jgi:SAM-dependent methyltransferase